MCPVPFGGHRADLWRVFRLLGTPHAVKSSQRQDGVTDANSCQTRSRVTTSDGYRIDRVHTKSCLKPPRLRDGHRIADLFPQPRRAQAFRPTVSDRSLSLDRLAAGMVPEPVGPTSVHASALPSDRVATIGETPRAAWVHAM